MPFAPLFAAHAAYAERRMCGRYNCCDCPHIGKPNAEPLANVGFSFPSRLLSASAATRKKDLLCKDFLRRGGTSVFSVLFCFAEQPHNPLRSDECQRPTFAHTCAFAERCSGARYDCCQLRAAGKPNAERSERWVFLNLTRFLFVSSKRNV